MEKSSLQTINSMPSTTLRQRGKCASYEVDLLSKNEYYPYGMKINELSYNNGILDSIGLSGGNHGWPFYPSFVKGTITNKRKK